MGKPFKVDASDPGIVRDAQSGRFQRATPPAPPEVVKRAVDEGRDTTAVIREVRVAEHATPKGQPQAAAEMEPMPDGPINDANRKPFKVG